MFVERLEKRDLHAVDYRSQVDPIVIKSDFFHAIVAWNTSEAFDKTIRLLDFYDDPLVRDKHHNDTLVLEGFLFLKKEQYQDPDRAHAINFIADTALAYTKVLGNGDYFWRDRPDEAILERVFDNVLATVVERPLEQATGSETRIEQWENHNGRLRLRCGAGYLDDILITAEASKQKAPFEALRYSANRQNYFGKLLPGRTNGDQRTFVEFSPTPDLTEDARGRGYFGKDAVYFFEFDPQTRREMMTQRWLVAPRSAYIQLLRTLGRSMPDGADDVAIMQQSDFFSSEQSATIHQFIEEYHRRLYLWKEHIEAHVHDEIRPFLERALSPILGIAAAKLIHGQDFSHEMNMIVATLQFAQAKMNTMIADISGLNLPGYTISARDEAEFLQLNPADRIRFAKERNLPLVGCGININQNPYGIPTSMGDAQFAIEGWNIGKCTHCQTSTFVRCGWCKKCSVEVYGHSEE